MWRRRRELQQNWQNRQQLPKKGPIVARRTMQKVIWRVMQQKMEMQRERLAAQVWSEYLPRQWGQAYQQQDHLARVWQRWMAQWALSTTVLWQHRFLKSMRVECGRMQTSWSSPRLWKIHLKSRYPPSSLQIHSSPLKSPKAIQHLAHKTGIDWGRALNEAGGSLGQFRHKEHH